MKIIKEANDKILKFWGSPKMQVNDIYRLMKYVLVCDCEEGMLLQNCVTGELALLDEDEANVVNHLPLNYSANMDELIKKHFLVPNYYDDKKSVLQLRNIARLMSSKKSITAYTILPTTACNARCFYCYESGVEHVTMTEETAAQLVKYIKEKSGGNKVSLNWFGGEPLLCINQIDKIVNGLKENNVEFTSAITTNGYLFSEKIIRHAKEEWKLFDVQITIDGTEEVYNTTKAYVNATGSPFLKVLENIGHLLNNGILVKLRVNLSMHNYNDAKTLIDQIADHFSERKLLVPYIALIYEDVGFKPIRYDKTSVVELELKKQELENLIMHYGFPNYQEKLPYLDTIHCMADNDQAVLINPRGEIGLCEHHIFDNLVGDIFSDGLNSETIVSWKEMFEIDECDSCALYPSCLTLKKCPIRKTCTAVKQESMINYVKKHMREFYNSQNIKS